jgi:site-specific recombinase XerD
MKSDDIRSLQKKTMIIVMFETGIRVSELLSLKVKYLKKDFGQFIVEFPQKGGVNHKVVLSDLAICYLGRFIEELERLGVKKEEDHYLFLTKHGRRFDRKNFYLILRRQSLVSGAIGMHPHSARVSYIRQKHHEGMDIYTIRKKVGHSSVSTTERYLG